METLFNHSCFDEISILIYRKPGYWKFTTEQFRSVINKKELSLILEFLKIRECRVLLDQPEIQEKIVYEYMVHGNTIYYGIEMLNFIYKTNWSMHLTK